MKGKLLLIPTPLGGPAAEAFLPATLMALEPIRCFVVENLRTARRLLRTLFPEFPIDDCRFFVLDEQTKDSDIPSMLAPLMAGEDTVLMSEAGCPATADPGAKLVAMAHERGITVLPFIGPSSILLALMASGLNGQNFSFRGYLPAKINELGPAIRKAEAIALREKQTQIFIETPYRNQALVTAFLEHLSPTTHLCLACDLSLGTQWIQTHPVAIWKNRVIPNLHKRPTVFLIG
jgi:16S rRNA (cytidine1402-2'-O)-methyltransferase